jgi:hypothetical protein
METWDADFVEVFAQNFGRIVLDLSTLTLVS